MTLTDAVTDILPALPPADPGEPTPLYDAIQAARAGIPAPRPSVETSQTSPAVDNPVDNVPAGPDLDALDQFCAGLSNPGNRLVAQTLAAVIRQQQAQITALTGR